MTRPRLFLLILLLVIAGVSASAWTGRQRWRLKAAVAPQARSDEVEVVTALGLFEPESKVVRVDGPPGARLDRLAENLEEGTIAKRGDALAFLDSNAEMAAARDLAASQWDDAQKRYRAETDFAEAAIENARLRIKRTEQALPLEIEVQRTEVRRAQAELEKARVDFDRVKNLLQRNATPQSEYDGFALMIRQCEEQLAKSQASQRHLEIDLDIQRALAQAELRSAQANLSRNQLSAQVELLQRALQLAEARLERTLIRAPIDGEILKIKVRPGETLGTQPVFLMGNTSSMYVTAEVYETDVRHVRSGQSVRITSSAFPERLSGRVERVSTLVHKNDLLQIDPTADTDARVIEVRVRLDESDIAARFNHHQVDVEIDVASRRVGETAATRVSLDTGATASIP